MTDRRPPPAVSRAMDEIEALEPAHPGAASMAQAARSFLTGLTDFLRSVDRAVYWEFENISNSIRATREELGRLSTDELAEDRLPRAGRELEAIVKTTEEATHAIMTAAEEIMAAPADDHEAFVATVNDAVMRIFEACAFQDITGQRISKVIETLTYIEARVTELRESPDFRRLAGEMSQKDAERPEAADPLLSGPALDGEGVDQAGVDEILNAKSGGA